MIAAEEARTCVTGHSAMIFDRGGKRKIDELVDLAQVKWERTRDGISEASVRISADNCAQQKDLLDALRTHRHELVIFRGNDRVWEGPLHRIASYSQSFEIVAKDVLSYLDFTPLTQRWSNAYPNSAPVTTRIGDIINYELTHGRTQLNGDGVVVAIPAWEALSPAANVAPHVVVHHFPNEARTAATTLPYEMSVYEHLAALGRSSGIDFTTVGRAIHIWDTSRAIGNIRALTEADFDNDVILTEYGADHAQAAYVSGPDGGYGQAVNTANLDYYGPWTSIYSAYNEEATAAPTQSELNSQASRNLSGRSPAPVEVRVPDNSTIYLDDTLGINDLVCGVQADLRATVNARSLSQRQKIDHVSVTEDAASETIQVTLTPASRQDSDEES